MTILRHSSAAVILAASLAATAYAAAAPDVSDAPAGDHSQDQDRDGAHGGPDHGMHRPHDDFGGHGPGGPGFGPDGGPGQPHGLHRLHLTEAQQDKLFALHHAAEPQRREEGKLIRKAHETLRELARADRFDEAKATAAARDLGQAIAAETLGQARLEAQVRAVLTPEQREQLRRERPPGPPRQDDAPAHR